MRKLTLLLIALIAGTCAMQVNAERAKAPMRSAIFSSLPSGFQQLGNTCIYYDVSSREAAGPGTQTGFSILGKIGNSYYSSTYEPNQNYIFWTDYGEGAGFIAAFRVNDGTASYLNAANGTTSNNVRMTANIEPQGEVAARIVYTLTNNNNVAVSIDAGVWADIMIGDNDQAPLECLKTSTGNTYGIKMKYQNTANTPLLCALFGQYVTGVETPADDYWFGFFSTNWHANELCGDYSNTVYNTTNNTYSQSQYGPYYMVENGSYDCGLGFCWKDRTIEPGESIELSYVISVGEIDFDEPIIPDPDEPEEFTYNIQAFDFDNWNVLTADHRILVDGHYWHPYGQEGFLEYQVDDENGWHKMGDLISGQDYEFDFNITFNESRMTDHKIEVRYNDGLDNITELDGLSWIDVRSATVSGAEGLVYDGTPKIIVVTFNGEQTSFGTGGEYILPGPYSFTAREGDFDEGTIGVLTVEFIIDKAPCDYTVIVPDDTPYDGEHHPATVIVYAGGDYSLSYRNMDTGEETTEAPIAPGTYIVVVEIAETDLYYGLESTGFGPFTIFGSPSTAVNELIVNGQDNGAWYTIDGARVAAPTQPGIYIHNGKKYIVK